MSQLISILLAASSLFVPTHGQPNWCLQLLKQPAYHYNYQGSRIDVPSGKKIILSEHPSQRECKALVKEYRSHR